MAGQSSKNKPLILVESPSKARTIEGYLQGKYEVIATKGHLIDLPTNKLGVDVEHNYQLEYVPIKGKKSYIKFIKQKTSKAPLVYLAQDPDREGEAIAWQVYSFCKKDCNKFKRIVFHEITPPAIKQALEAPREIDMNLVEAQRARRALDRLVGYPLSQLLWHKIRYGLSAGRVQSAALRLIVERHREIIDFKPETLFYVGLETPIGIFYLLNAKKHTKLALDKEAKDKEFEILEALDKIVVKEVNEYEEKNTPPPPFITSTLQQEANRLFGFSAKTTMQLAQQLYQGVDIPTVGRKGLITYMRTDSVQLSDLAIKQIRARLVEDFGKDIVNPTVRKYKTRSKLAQEAHEAIRPTYFNLSPQKLKGKLKPMLFKLYTLIWNRALATQAKPAVYRGKLIVADIESKQEGKYALNVKVLWDPGFKRIYGSEADTQKLSALEQILPGSTLEKQKVVVEEFQTKPPAYYTDATLVRKLEKLGIGRPSTFATIIDTLIKRGYVERQGKFLIPTDSGIIVNDFLVKHFPQIVDYSFTAKMEDKLDKIASGKLQRVAFLSEFYPGFRDLIAKKEESVQKQDLVILAKTDKKCPKCGAPMVLKLGRYGKFYSCSRFPECDGMLPYIDEEKYVIPEKAKIGEWVLKVGPYGKFWAHKDYPKVKETAPLLLKETCPKCGAHLIERRGKRGRIFIACSAYPKCKYIKK